MRFILCAFFICLTNLAYAEEIIMKCEGQNTITADGAKSLRDSDELVFKYESTMIGNPNIKVRKDGAWKSWCGKPSDGDVKSNKLKLGELGGACFSIRENEQFYLEVNYVVDFILRSYSIKSGVFKEKLRDIDMEAEGNWDCVILN